MSKRRLLATYAAIVAASAALALVVFELHFRWQLAKRIDSHFAQAHFWIQNQPISAVATEIDDILGLTVKSHPLGQFRTDTRIDTSVVPTDQKRRSLHFSVRINNVGLMSDHDYTIERSAAAPEFRIAVLGESFTGPTTATYQWVDTLEELLNNSPALVRAAGGKKIRAYNFGWVGAGFEHFWREYDRSARHFTPDFVVLNYLEIDFPRAKTHMTDEAEMAAHAAQYVRLLAAEKPLIATVMPDYSEVADPSKPLSRTQRLRALLPGIDIVDMRHHLKLPPNPKDAETWFNIPQDAHYSDRGGEHYVRALAKVIAKRMGVDADFSNARTRYGDLVMGPGTTR